MIDKFLLEAMREVDAMLPNTPPIAPQELTGLKLAAALSLANRQQQNALANMGIGNAFASQQQANAAAGAWDARQRGERN